MLDSEEIIILFPAGMVVEYKVSGNDTTVGIVIKKEY